MKPFSRIAIAVAVVLALAGLASAQSWVNLTHQPGVNLGAIVQLRDGRILVHEEQQGNSRAWHLLTPDATGSYVNGTWTTIPNMPSTYSPWFFGSQVLLDGHTLVVEGGEYNFGSAVWTTLGAVLTYSGNTFTWVSNSPPTGWSTIGDAQSVVLPNGQYMQANCCTAQNAIYNGPNSWLTTGNVKAIRNDESGWTLLPTGKVLAVDVQIVNNCGGSTRSSELYDPTSGTWSCAAQTPVQLWLQSDQELGAGVLMRNGKVFQMGGNVNASAVYNVAANTWAAGPTPPNGLDQADGPSALEPNGKVLAMLSPGLFQGGCQMMEFNPVTSTLANAPNPTNCPSDSSFVGHLFMMPSGQILFTDLGPLVQAYNPAPGVEAGAAPTILAASTRLTIGSTNNLLYGKQLNGLSQNNAYGDDWQGDVNFPLVRLTNTSTGNVYWALTHDDSTHSIAPNTIMFTKFDIPATVPAGNYNLAAIAAGVASNSIVVTLH